MGTKETTEEQLIRLYPDLVRLASSFSLNGHSEDVVQTTILYLLGRSREGNPSKELNDSYILRCVRDRSLNWLRDQATRNRVVSDYRYVAESSCDSALNELLVEVDLDVLGLAMKKLSDRESTIIFMRYWWGKTIRQTANEMGMSKSVVHRCQDKALSKLRRTLNAQ